MPSDGVTVGWGGVWVVAMETLITRALLNGALPGNVIARYEAMIDWRLSDVGGASVPVRQLAAMWPSVY